jgi:hypothetical protein
LKQKKTRTGEKHRSSQLAFSGQAILVMLIVKEVLHLASRQTEGFMHSLFALLKIARLCQIGRMVSSFEITLCFRAFCF